MKKLGYIVVKNALSNVVRLGAAGMVALALPHFLTRSMNHDRFAAWSLMLQIAAYAAYLDFGLQLAVARYLAQAIERNDELERDRLISTTFAMLTIAGVVAAFIFGTLIILLPAIFRGIPISLVGEARLGLTFLVVGATLGLPMSTFTGALIGLHRNDLLALTAGGTKLISALAVLAAVHYTNSLALLALCIIVPNLMNSLIQFLAVKGLLPGMRLTFSQVTMQMARELAKYCSSLTIFSVGMLLVSGLDVTIVGYFDFGAVGYYAVSVTVISLFVGLNTSVVSATMTPVAVLQTRGELKRIKDLLLVATCLNTYANLLFTSLVFVMGNVLLSAWVGHDYALKSLPILELLMLAQIVRMIGNPYSTVLAATGQQRIAISYAVAEAIANLACSLVGIRMFGPIGVAWGTLIGALVSLICMLLFAMPRARLVPIGAKEFLWIAALKPMLFYSPIILLVIGTMHHAAPFITASLCIFYTLIVSYGQAKSLVIPLSSHVAAT